MFGSPSIRRLELQSYRAAARVPAKVAQLDRVRGEIDQQVVWLDVAVADPHGVQVVERLHEAVHARLHSHWQRTAPHLNERNGNGQPLLLVVLENAVQRHWHVLEDQAEKLFVLLVARVVVSPQRNNVWMCQALDDRQLAVLQSHSSLAARYLVAFVLENGLDRNNFVRAQITRATHDPKRPVANHVHVAERKLLGHVVRIKGRHGHRLVPDLLNCPIYECAARLPRRNAALTGLLLADMLPIFRIADPRFVLPKTAK